MVRFSPFAGPRRALAGPGRTSLLIVIGGVGIAELAYGAGLQVGQGERVGPVHPQVLAHERGQPRGILLTHRIALGPEVGDRGVQVHRGPQNHAIIAAAAALQARAESTPEIPARRRHQEDGHRETPGHRVRTRLLLAGHPRTGPVRKEEPPAQAGPRTVEPRAAPAATRGPNLCPHTGNATTKTDSRTETEHEHCYTSESLKHLKSVVLR